MMTVRGSIVEMIENNPASGMLDSICHSHADYTWEIRFAK
jgi:hypothetical protein